MTDASLEIAQRCLLAPAELTEEKLASTLGQLLGPSIDSGDFYFQSSVHEGWAIEDGIIKSGQYNIDRGVGVRAISGEKTGFAYSDEIALSALEQATVAARGIAQAGQVGKVQVQAKAQALTQNLYPLESPLIDCSTDDKLNILRLADEVARATDPRIQQVMASLSAVYEIVLVFDHNGRLSADVRPLLRFGVNVIAEQNGRREQANMGGGGRGRFVEYCSPEKIREYAEEASRQALLNLEAIPAPAGTLPVVLGPGWPGILLHEAIGHGLEGDFNRKGTSAFSGRVGERVAAKGCTVVDDGTLPGRRGSLNIDDEGMPTQCTTLIEDGILRGYMQDSLNARLMNVDPTGNGRRESYAHLPMPRMTNTYMLNGNYDPEEIIASVDKGLYAVNFGGGQVDITSGKFVFSASEAYLIENGKITTPVKGATLIGNGPDVLTRVSMIGNDLGLDSGVGTCGKDGQSVPVGVGQPTLKVDSLTVGGTSND